MGYPGISVGKYGSGRVKRYDDPLDNMKVGHQDGATIASSDVFFLLFFDFQFSIICINK